MVPIPNSKQNSWDIRKFERYYLEFPFNMIEERKENIIVESISRPPVVVVLGHVDSGKTSILDAIRKSHVAEKETGGITQHIGAYQIEKDGKKITFIDTPGHEAFSAMRARGAKVADIAILVVDATQGVQDQTREAISHIKKAAIPLIVALNKIDRPEANPAIIKQQLSKEGVLVESFGGKVPLILTSAKTGEGIEELLEMILLLAEIEDLKADISKKVEGTIIESYLEDKRGPLATAIINEGILKKGDIIGTPSAVGRVRNLENFQGKIIDKAFPADPVVILGFEEVPRVGEKFTIFEDMEKAKESLQSTEQKEKREVFEIQPGQKILNLILKTDVLGSLEAISGILTGLPQDKIILKILKAEVGDVDEADLKLAKSTRALILGFRVKIPPIIETIAEREKIKIKTFEIIYELVEGVRKFMEKIMEPEIIREDFGKVKVLAIFLTEKSRQVVGGKVFEGEVRKGASIEILRGEEVVGQGKLINLQRNKKDTDKVEKGEECGILYEGNVRVEEGDVLVIYQEKTRKI
jgi:translation initiation factor IF-2